MEKHLQASNDKKEEENRIKKEQHDKLLSEMNESREKARQKKEEERRKNREEDIKYIEDYKLQMEKLKEEDEKEKEMRRIKERDLAQYQKLQNEEKKRIIMDEFVRMNKDSYLNLKRLENENDDFIKYAEYQIEKYKSQGKNVLPLLIELKKYKQKYCIH